MWNWSEFYENNLTNPLIFRASGQLGMWNGSVGKRYAKGLLRFLEVMSDSVLQATVHIVQYYFLIICMNQMKHGQVSYLAYCITGYAVCMNSILASYEHLPNE